MLLNQNETILYECQPDPAIRKVWWITKVIPGTLLGAFLLAWATGFFGGIALALVVRNDEIIGRLMPKLFLYSLGIGLPLIVIGLILYYNQLWKTFHYYITDKRCVFEGGIFVRRERSAYFDRITDVEITQFLWDRWFGLSSLRIFTPGTESAGRYGFQRAEIVFEGLKDVQTPYRIIMEVRERGKKGQEDW